MTTHLRSVFATIPWWYIALAAAWSLYHGYRGYVLQYVTVQSQRKLTEREPSQAGTPDQWFWSPIEVTVVRTGYDALFYGFCSVVGFAALWLAGYVFNSVQDIHDIPGGTSALLVFLVVWGLVGVSGQLPYLILLGKLPK
jgi:hypothetical protein